MLATQSCHPLESNQDLPGFSRARRPSTQEWRLLRVPLLELRLLAFIVVLFDFQAPRPRRVAVIPRWGTSIHVRCSRRSSGPRIRTLICRSRAERPTVGRALNEWAREDSNLPSPGKSRVRCHYATSPRNGSSRRVFASSSSSRGRARNRTESVQSTRGLQPRPEPRRSARPKTKKPPLFRAAPDRFGYLHRVYRLEPPLRRSWAAAGAWYRRSLPPSFAQSRARRAYTCPANAFAFLALDVFVDEIDMGSTRGRLARWTGTCQRSCREESLIVIMTRFNQLAELIFVRANMPLGRRLA